MMDRSHLNQNHMKNANYLQEVVHKNVQNVHHLHGYMPGDAFFTGQLQCQYSIITCRKSGHTAIKHSFSSLRILNERKAKCWYFAWC